MSQRQFRSDDTSTWNDGFGYGSDGAYSTAGSLTDSSRTGYSCTNIDTTATSTSASVTAVGNFAAGDIVLIHQSRGTLAGTWELNKISSVGGGTNWTLAYAATFTSSNVGANQCQVYRLLQYSSININSGHTLTSVAYNGARGGIIALLCNGTTTITGNISVAGVTGALGVAAGGAGIGFRGGASTNVTQSQYGEGTSGANATSSTSAANGSGGGGSWGNSESAAHDGAGGGGGNAVAGGAGIGNGAAYNGLGGGTAGNAALTSMVFGGGGGGGSNRTTPSYVKSSGGGGAGIVLLISKTITVTGTINLNGGVGPTSDGGGGGGAGGSCLLKGQTITLGSNLITATGGSAFSGGTGGAGRIHVDYKTSISGSTSPTLNSTQDATLNEAVVVVSAQSYSFFM